MRTLFFFDPQDFYNYCTKQLDSDTAEVMGEILKVFYIPPPPQLLLITVFLRSLKLTAVPSPSQSTRGICVTCLKSGIYGTQTCSRMPHRMTGSACIQHLASSGPRVQHD